MEINININPELIAFLSALLGFIITLYQEWRHRKNHKTHKPSNTEQRIKVLELKN